MGSFRDGRSFAAVLSGREGPPPPPPPPPELTRKPISLEVDTFWAHWIDSPLTLIGVVHSLEHLKNLPTGIRLGHSSAYGMKYLGGLSVGIRFRSEGDVDEFLKNENYWREWFIETKRGNSYDALPGRIAWLKIIGLPLHMWSEGNFERIERIAGTVGKVLSPSEISMRLQDVSCGKICVLTKRKIRINEEVAVEFNKNIIKVGISEVDFEWSPFPSCNWSMDDYDGHDRSGDLENLEKNEDSNSEDKDEGISETIISSGWKPINGGLPEDELEEGEFRHGEFTEDEVMEAMDVRREPSPEIRTWVGETPICEARPSGGDPTHGEFQPTPTDKCQRVDRGDDQLVDHSNVVATQVVNNVNIGMLNPDLLKLGCFGPFKCGPVNMGGRKLPKSFGPLNENKDDSELEIDSIDDGSTRKKLRRSSLSRLDLNCNPCNSSDSTHDLNIGDDETISHRSFQSSGQIKSTVRLVDNSEATLTVEIGKMVDVDIEFGNEVLEEVLGMEGESNNHNECALFER
ncbi:unnamed protein product [Lactuca virosa]|uniref:DUF4283 domain-containing protein n=1 Tax=Lactuca virosa TaxID=75947 RepID=A0AAU9PDQ7_9ASTR|nr:unnamed protein product [Lactuca virosa]